MYNYITFSIPHVVDVVGVVDVIYVVGVVDVVMLSFLHGGVMMMMMLIGRRRMARAAVLGTCHLNGLALRGSAAARGKSLFADSNKCFTQKIVFFDDADFDILDNHDYEGMYEI